MKIKTTQNLLYWGRPNRKPLYKWIKKIDLEKWNIFVKDPLSVRNFIVQFTDYTSDSDQFGFIEFWQDPKIILETSKDDCEGLNALVCSVLYTLGYDCRFAIGNYNNGKYDYTNLSERPLNHAYGLLFINEFDENPLIIECTGNHVISKLQHIDENDKYYTKYCGSAIYQKNYICNHWAVE